MPDPLPAPPSATDSALGWRKACDACHAAKVRCAPHPSSPVGACKRCADYGLRCNHSFRGARRKPTQTKRERIADLERRVHLLLQERGLGVVPESDSPPDSLFQASGCDSGSGSVPPSSSPRSGDAVDLGLLTAAEADRLFLGFRERLEGHSVGTWLPKSTSSADLRRSSPILWTSVIYASAASGGENPPLCQALSRMVDDALRDQLTHLARPSLEIMCAAQIYMSYHHEPKYNRMQEFLHYVTVGCAMVVRLAEAELGSPDVAEDTVIDVAREVLCWYWISMIVSVKTGQPLLLARDRLVCQSEQVIERLSDRADRSLICWVNLARINFDATVRLGPGSATTGRDAVAREFEERLREWRADCPEEVLSEELFFEYHFSVIFITDLYCSGAGNEPGRGKSQSLPPLDAPHASTDLAMPWNDRALASVSAAHTMLETFTSMEPDQVRCVGVTVFGRVFYALRFLFRVLYLVVAGASSPVSVGSLKTDVHVEALVRCLQRAADGAQGKAPTMWLYALQSRMLPWYRELRRKFNLCLDQPPPRGAGPASSSAPAGARPEKHNNSLVPNAATEHRGGSSDDVDVLRLNHEDLYNLVIL